jgi:hypothetical protein
MKKKLIRNAVALVIEVGPDWLKFRDVENGNVFTLGDIDTQGAEVGEQMEITFWQTDLPGGMSQISYKFRMIDEHA